MKRTNVITIFVILVLVGLLILDFVPKFEGWDVVIAHFIALGAWVALYAANKALEVARELIELQKTRILQLEGKPYEYPHAVKM